MPSQTFYNLKKEKKERVMHAAIKEFGMRTYENVNLANIIRDANIPRGSFYQYFTDKHDLYRYFYEELARMKFAFFGDLFTMQKDIPFLERFHQIYTKGFEFRLHHPELVEPSKKMMSSKVFLETEMVQQGMNYAIDLFTEFIQKDQMLGRIKKSIDARLIATMILEFMNKITLEDFLQDELNVDIIHEKVLGIIEIFRKGIEIDV
ncbi:MAG: TetR/AcrR family transcriptional regulator [Acholeplasmataceae bacterium]|nr:TetR/AcrR family transcriptional regulator [Acholeplasmataceae bacterium]